jgi:hypothetical protein
MSYSAAISAEAAGSWTRIFYPIAPSDTAPQQFPDPCCWESECSDNSSCSEPITEWTEVLRLWGERSLCQLMPQSAQRPPQTVVFTPVPTREANSVPVAIR